MYGGAGDEFWGRLARDGQGNIYVAASTTSPDLPVSANAMQKNLRGGSDWGDVFVAKFDGALKKLTYGTYMGGNSEDALLEMDVDAAGSAYITGWTQSTNLAITANTAHGFRGGVDGYLLKLSADGSKADFLSYLGGANSDYMQAIAVSGNGALVAGTTRSTDLPETGPGSYQPALRGDYDSFLMRLDLGGNQGGPVTISAIANAANYAGGKVSPGEIAVLFGSGIGPGALSNYALTDQGYLATSVANTRVLFDGLAAPIVYASAGQTAAIVPYGVHGKAAVDVVVESNGVRSAALRVPVVEAVPALFSADRSGKGPGAILNQDGTLNSASNPAAPGSVVVLYGTGEGQTAPLGVDGKPGPATLDGLPRPALPVSVTIGGLPAEVAYAGGVPYVVAGEFQINVVVPGGLAPGDHEVVARFGNYSTQAGVTVRIN